MLFAYRNTLILLWFIWAYRISSYEVGFNSIDLYPKAFNNQHVTIESPIFRNATPTDKFDFFVKVFPDLQLWINENNPSFSELVSKKFRGYKTNFYFYSRVGGESVLESLTAVEFVTKYMKVGV